VGAGRREVVVLGAGVVGLACALELSGDWSVTLVDPAPGRGASWAAAGMLSPAAEVAPGEEALVADLVAASARWPAFAERVGAVGGVDVGFEAVGSVLVGASPSDVREAARLAAAIAAAGHRIEPVDAERLAALEPSLAGDLRGGWLLDGDHRVDNRRLVDGLLAACKASGVTMLEDRCVEVVRGAASVRCALEHQGDAVADRVVVATGAAVVPEGLGGLGLPVVRPVRGATLRCTAVLGVSLPHRTVRGVAAGRHCYLVPRATRALVVGATVEEQGHALVARAGGVHELLDAARRLLPSLDELALDEVAVGLRPATPDQLPFVGTLGDDRIVAALGHYRNGVLLAPLAAAQVAAELRRGPLS
jgi:glycine oxidase